MHFRYRSAAQRRLYKVSSFYIMGKTYSFVFLAKCRRDGVKMGRPATYKKSDDTYKQQYAKELALLKKGISLRNVRQSRARP